MQSEKPGFKFRVYQPCGSGRGPSLCSTGRRGPHPAQQRPPCPRSSSSVSQHSDLRNSERALTRARDVWGPPPASGVVGAGELAPSMQPAEEGTTQTPRAGRAAAALGEGRRAPPRPAGCSPGCRPPNPARSPSLQALAPALPVRASPFLLAQAQTAPPWHLRPYVARPEVL